MRHPAVVVLAAALLSSGNMAAQESISRYTRDLEKRDGYFPLYWDETEGRLLLEIPRVGEEFLYLTSLATGLGSSSLGLDRGMISSEAIARFERQGPKAMLVFSNPRFRAGDGADTALVRSVEESFPTSTVAAFEVLAEGEDGGILVDVTPHLMQDRVGVAQRLRNADQGSFSLSRDRSSIYLPRTKAFPRNTEIEVSLTFTSEDPGPIVREHAPDGRAVTLRQHHSLVELPDGGYRPRRSDPHIGIFGVTYYDFSHSYDRSYRSSYIARHRLQKRDPEAPMSEPVQPIVYYLDPAIPEPYRTAFREGAMWWNRVFEAAGFIDGFRVEDMPEDMDPMDARYNVIQWVHRTDPGSSIGPSFTDPRTGEIIKAAVRMDSYRSLTDFGLYAGIAPTLGEPDEVALDTWLASLDPDTDAEAFVMARRRQHAAHEIGHTLGLAHNFIAASQGRASVMDYPAPLVRLVDGRIDLSEAYREGPGLYDSLAIRYAYTEFPDGQEEAGLEAIVREAIDRGIEFNTGDDAAGWGSFPEVTQWINGEDAVEELQRVMEVRRVLIDEFGTGTIQPGEPLALLSRRFVPVYLHHRFTLQAAVKAIGGMEYRYAVRGDGLEPTAVIEPERQRRALELVLNTLEPEELAIPESTLTLLTPRAFGLETDGWSFASNAAPAFDQIGAARTLATMVVGSILAPRRMARLVAFHDRNSESPAPEEVIARIIERSWGALDVGQYAALRRMVQRVVVDGLIDLAADAGATVEARAAAEWGLRRISEMIQTRAVRLPEEEAHQALAAADIQRFLNRIVHGSDRSKALDAPPGTPIGQPPRVPHGGRRP